jgi:hypothetical protein
MEYENLGNNADDKHEYQGKPSIYLIECTGKDCGYMQVSGWGNQKYCHLCGKKLEHKKITS